MDQSSVTAQIDFALASREIRSTAMEQMQVVPGVGMIVHWTAIALRNIIEIVRSTDLGITHVRPLQVGGRELHATVK